MPKPIQKYKPGQAIPKEEFNSTIYALNVPKKQQIHLLSIKASSEDGYERAINALTGRIVSMTTTPQHLIVVTE